MCHHESSSGTKFKISLKILCIGSSGSSGRSLSRFLYHEATRSTVFLVRPRWDGGYLNIKFAGPKNRLAKEHNPNVFGRARTRTARSGVERTGHEATAPPRGKIDIKEELIFVSSNPACVGWTVDNCG